MLPDGAEFNLLSTRERRRGKGKKTIIVGVLVRAKISNHQSKLSGKLFLE